MVESVTAPEYEGGIKTAAHAKELNRISKEAAEILKNFIKEMGFDETRADQIGVFITEHYGCDSYGNHPVRVSIDSNAFDGGTEGAHIGSKIAGIAAGVFIGAFKAKNPMLNAHIDKKGALKHGGLTVGFESLEDALMAINSMVGDNHKINSPLVKSGVGIA